MRESTKEEAGHGHEEVQAGTDRDLAAADRSGNRERQDDTASLQGSRNHGSDLGFAWQVLLEKQRTFRYHLPVVGCMFRYMVR